MRTSRTLRRAGLAVALLVAFLVQGTWVLAGTTGGLSGQVTDKKLGSLPCAGTDGGRPASASQTARAAQMVAAIFTFVSLPPDAILLLRVSRQGYNPNVIPGIRSSPTKRADRRHYASKKAL